VSASPPQTPISLRIALLRLDGDTQPRETINYSVVEEYAERIQAGDKFPPVVAFFDGEHYWLGDGFHRVYAHQSVGLEDVEAGIRPGSRADAVWFACSANRAHGLRRGNADKRRAVTMALASPQAQGMSDRQLAEHCGVGHVFVGMVRKELAGVHGEHVEGGVRTGRDGKQYALNSGKRAAAGRASAQKRVAQKAQNGDTIMTLPGSQNAPDQIEMAQAPQPQSGPAASDPPPMHEDTEAGPLQLWLVALDAALQPKPRLPRLSRFLRALFAIRVLPPERQLQLCKEVMAQLAEDGCGPEPDHEDAGEERALEHPMDGRAEG
jgi:hypothetical protein